MVKCGISGIIQLVVQMIKLLLCGSLEYHSLSKNRISPFFFWSRITLNIFWSCRNESLNVYTVRLVLWSISRLSGAKVSIVRLSTEELCSFNNLTFYDWATPVLCVLQFEEWGFWRVGSGRWSSNGTFLAPSLGEWCHQPSALVFRWKTDRAMLANPLRHPEHYSNFSP